jgi:hypothetical protein
MLVQRWKDRLQGARGTRWTLALVALVGLVWGGCRSGSFLEVYGAGLYIIQLLTKYFTPQGLLEAEALQQEEEEEGPSVDFGNSLDFEQSGCKVIPSMFEFELWGKTFMALLLALALQATGLITVQVFWPILALYVLVSFGWVVFRLDVKMKKYKYTFASFF